MSGAAGDCEVDEFPLTRYLVWGAVSRTAFETHGRH
jgi:hypothetical protein